MNGFQKIGVIIAATGMISAAFLPGRQTVAGINAFFNGLTKWSKVQQGRG
jgi:hypothetical protein